MRLTLIAIQCFQIEIELAQALRLEAADFQFDCDQAVEAPMEKQQVECEVTAADLKRVLGANEAEIPAQLDQELFEPIHQRTLQIRFDMATR